MSGQPTLFVIDDDRAARSRLSELARAKGAACETFASAEAFLAACDGERPGCVVIEMQLSSGDCFELQDRLRGHAYAPPVIVHTAHADVPSTVRAMRAGAFTVLEKPCDEAELWGAIARAFAVDAERRRRDARKIETRARLAQLTPQEQRVMQAVIEGKMNKAIARELDVSTRTVERDRANVMQKLGVENVAQLVERVVEVRE